MKERVIACLATATLSFGAATGAQAALNSCDDPLKSGLGERFCHEKFENVPSGFYNVSFEYQAEKFAGNSDKALTIGFLFDTLGGPQARGVLSDVSPSPTRSFITEASGSSRLLVAQRGVSGPDFGMQLQDLQIAPVHQPGTYAMLLAGLGALAFVGHRRRL